MSIKASIYHLTHYKYDNPVRLGPQIIRLKPAAHSRTKVLSHSLKVTPANHFVNWVLLCAGIGLLITQGIARRWVVVTLVTGLGAILAIGWELGEWYTFIRHGTELGTAYTDTLGDEALGTLGALVAGVLVSRRPGRSRSA